MKQYEEIADRMFSEVADNVKDFEADTTDYEFLFEKHFEMVFGEYYSEADYLKALESQPVKDMIDEIKTFVREHWEDQIAYYESPIKYYGLTQKEFI